jgi:hypothetical protein
MMRRLDAVCQYYGVAHAELEDWLCVTNTETFPLRVAEIGSGDRFSPDRNLLADMYEQIRANGLEVIGMDPLITLHGVPENNQVMMRGVMDIFRDMAASLDCSIEIVGHTRKPSMGFDGQLTAYDTRGAGAIVDAFRSVRMLDLMTTEEAEKAGVEEYEQQHVKVTPAKRNYSATSAPPQWIRIENLIINNGDDVGVIGPWEWPGHDPAAFEAAVQRAQGVFLEVVSRLIKTGQRLSNRTGKNFAPRLIARTPEAKQAKVTEAALKEAMERLILSGKSWCLRATRMAIRCTNSGLLSRFASTTIDITTHILPPRHRIYVVCPHLTPERGLHPRMVRRSLGSAPHAPLPCVGSGPAPSNTPRPFFVGEDLKDAPREQIQE